jgi:hypothetical protein
VDAPQKSLGNKRTLIIVIAAVVVVFLGSILCCVGGFGGMIYSISSVEKTYYPECEQLSNIEECDACCKGQGAHGHIFGEFLNEEGKLCGCI